MKKFFTLLAVSAFTVSADAQYFDEDFEGGSLTGNNAWTTEMVIGTSDWYYDNFSGDNFAEVNSYPDDAEVWLISPAIDLSGATMPVATFQNTSGNFDGPDLEFYVSTTYGGGAINMGDWTQLTIPNLSPGSGDGYTEVASGDIDLTSYISANTYIAFRHQGSSTAPESQEYQIDDILVAEQGASFTDTVSIDSIQYSLGNPADSPYMGDDVITFGIVTALEASGDGYWIQDGNGPWDGIYVYDQTNTPSVGDSVEVEGSVDEFFETTQIDNVVTYTLHSTGNTVPNSGSISSNDAATLEDYEGCFVTVAFALCTNDNAGFGLWEANDGSGPVLVDDECYDNSATLNEGYDISGVMTYHSQDGYKINPRTGADIVVVGNVSIDENTNEVTIYPNPATNNVVINASAEAIVSIYSVTGALVVNGISNKTIDISNLESGLYHVVITENGKNSTKKLIIE